MNDNQTKGRYTDMNSTTRTKNPAAIALGRMGKGHKKTITEQDREARRQRMNAVNARRRARMSHGDGGPIA
jgi:hypothetical protein